MVNSGFSCTCGHCDHEEVDAVPVGHSHGAGKCGQVARVFKLEEERRGDARPKACSLGMHKSQEDADSNQYGPPQTRP